MPPDGPLQQTFGVELEFVVKVLPQSEGFGGFSYFNGRTAVEEPMAELLTAGGFAVNEIGTRGSYEKWSIENDVSIKPENSEDDEPKMAYLGVELKSRVLPVNRDSYEEICEVVDIVNGNFRIVRNPTTGLHIHVGNGKRGYTLRCLKNLAQLVTLFEHQIQSLHPDDRIANSFCDAPSDNMNIHGDPFHRMMQIEEIQDLEAFIEHMNPDGHRFTAYNFLNLEAPRNIQTVEFRQHRGTMDTSEIIAWVEFTTGIRSRVAAGNRENSPDLLLQKKIGDSTTPTILLDRAGIGLPYRLVIQTSLRHIIHKP